LLPALAVTALGDAITFHMAPAVLSGAFAQAWHSGPGYQCPWSGSLWTLIGNICFLQTILVPVYGSNSPMWSLANEFWYYFLFPLALIAIGTIGNASKLSRIFSVTFFIAGCFALPRDLLCHFSIWLLGVFVWLCPHKPHFRQLPVYSFGMMVFAGALIASKTHVAPLFLLQLLLGISFAIFAIPLRQTARVTTFVDHAIWGLSELSYSLYLFHFPFVIAVAGIFYKGSRMQPTFGAFVQFGLWLTLIIFGSIGFWWLFERNTHAIRRRLSAIILREPRNAAEHPARKVQIRAPDAELTSRER
jgi:peptidoglycan/LPS O-acetylase OafA/YrhL